MIIDYFEERIRQIADGKPQVMGIALHPYLVGQPHRMRHLRRALEHITARRGDIWITTAGAIYDHVLTLPKGIIPGGGDAPSVACLSYWRLGYVACHACCRGFLERGS
jgi:hypothetical protein